MTVMHVKSNLFQVLTRRSILQRVFSEHTQVPVSGTQHLRGEAMHVFPKRVPAIEPWSREKLGIL